MCHKYLDFFFDAKLFAYYLPFSHRKHVFPDVSSGVTICIDNVPKTPKKQLTYSSTKQVRSFAKVTDKYHKHVYMKQVEAR